jgi:hypothetical protein
MKILMTGATGFIGKELGLDLVRQGHEILVVTRDRDKAREEDLFTCEVIEGDLMKEPIFHHALRDVEAVIHLMGESVAGGRWSEERKNRILLSRTLGTRNLIRSLRDSGNGYWKVFLSASAVGYYGDRDDEELHEQSGPGDDFLAQVCVEWEKEVFSARSEIPHLRVAAFRQGLVLGSKGGALAKMIPAFRLGMGGPLADGEQWVSWIHLTDVIRLYSWALKTTEASGIYNAVAPNPVRNHDFAQALAGALGKGLGPRIPRFALKFALGEMSEALLDSQKVRPRRLLEAGFSFCYPDIEEALLEAASLSQEEAPRRRSIS